MIKVSYRLLYFPGKGNSFTVLKESDDKKIVEASYLVAYYKMGKGAIKLERLKSSEGVTVVETLRHDFTPKSHYNRRMTHI